jgi:hypothetical protein
MAFVDSETVVWELTCPLQDHPVPGPYVWPASGEEHVDFGAALGLDLGASLILAVRTASDEHGEGRVEYGLVERAFGLAEPDDWGVLLARYDHRWYHGGDATRKTLPYTASKYLAGRLGALGRLGDIRYSPAKGTGYWSYLAKVSAWTVPGREQASLQSFGENGADMANYMPDARPR